MVDLSQQKKLDAELKAIQQIEFIWQFKNTDTVRADDTESVFV